MAGQATIQVRVHTDLFAWARAEGERVAEMRAEQAKRVERMNEAALSLEASPLWVAVELAKRDLKNARKALLDEDPAVLDAKEAVKAARKRAKGLAALAALKAAKADAKAGEVAIRQREADLASWLARGEAQAEARP